MKPLYKINIQQALDESEKFYQRCGYKDRYTYTNKITFLKLFPEVALPPSWELLDFLYFHGQLKMEFCSHQM